MRKIVPNKAAVKHSIAAVYWFSVGFILAGAILASLVLVYFQYTFKDKVIPGVFVNDIYIGEKTPEEIRGLFHAKNNRIEKNSFTLTTGEQTATVSAKTLKMGYDTDLIVDQAFNLGKTNNLPSDIFVILTSYINGTFLNAPYTLDREELEKVTDPIKKAVRKEPVDAQFSFENNKVVTFKQSVNGQEADIITVEDKIRKTLPILAQTGKSTVTKIEIPIKVLEPAITTEKANKFGIVEQIGEGRSTFYHSIASRVHNVAVATSKINGSLIAPGEEFSFVKTLGDVSAYTGYKQAYVIQNGKTVLGDGGGICQVSTTLFRAILNAGLPITERQAHAYRVGYYEQDQPPGLDATVYVPTVDLKFKNDTNNYILIQAVADTSNLTLTFNLYGKSDGRVSEITKPVISNTSPAPADIYQDDPTLPVGTVKQVDFAAPGAKSVFTRTVTKDGKTIISDTFTSIYRPWQAIFLRGTKT